MTTPFFIAGIAQDLGSAARDVGQTFGFNTHHFVAQIISFCIVAFLLHRFAFKPILRILEARRQRIAESLENAEKIKAELARADVGPFDDGQRSSGACDGPAAVPSG